MPVIPFDPSPNVAPAGAPGVFERVDASPEHFGSFTAAATQRLGASTEQLGDVLAKHALAFQQLHNETNVDANNNSFEKGKFDILFNTQNGFYGKQGKDAIDAMQPTAEAIEQLRVQTRDALENPEQRRMFDYMSRHATRQDLKGMEAHANKEAERWRMDTAKGTIATAVNDSATYWNDDQRFAQSLGTIKIHAEKLALQQGIDPASDAGRSIVTHYQSEAWSARVRSVMAQDPNVARELFDANADQMDAAHRATLDAQITQHQYTKMVRDESQARREEADAQRTMQRTQAGNLAQLTGDVLQGKPVNWGNLADMVRTQQLSPHVPEFLMSLQRRRAAGPEEDRADAVITLHQTLNDPSLSVDDKMKAISGAARAGSIKAATAGTLVDAAYRKDTKADSQVAREARESVFAAAGAPSGVVNLEKDEKARRAAAEVEWTNRVTVKGEDPVAVRDDMIPRYMAPGLPPATWPRPQYGPINSKQEAIAVAARTKAAFDAGQITPEKFNEEKANIVRFTQFYDRLDAAHQAAAAAKPQPSSGNKAKLKGVVPGEGS